MPPKPQNPILSQTVKWQISELIRLNAGARSINHSPPVYEIPIPTMYGRLTLHVAFPESNNQPNQLLTSAPTIQVASLVDHPWLDHDMYFTHHEGINQWNSQSNIGLIVREIVTEWTASPPMPLQPGKQLSNKANKQANKQSNSQSISQSTSSQDEWVMVDQKSIPEVTTQSTQSNSSSSQSSSQSNNQSNGNALMLPIPSSFEWIEKMSLAELERICNESASPSNSQNHNKDSSSQTSNNLSTNQAIVDSIYQHSPVAHIEQVKSGLFDELDKCAYRNIDQSDQYNKLAERLNEARQQANNLVTNQQALLERQQKLLQKFIPRSIIQLLDQAINQSEERSQAIQEAYLHGDEQSNNQSGSQANNQRHARFIESYVKERALLHLRQAKRERAVAIAD